MSIVFTKLVNSISTNSDNLLTVNKAPDNFVKWLKGVMDDKNLGVRGIAEKVGVSHPTISDIVTYGNKPSFDTCVAIAKAFNKDPVVILRCAGLLPPSPTDGQEYEDLNYLFAQLTDRDQREILENIRTKIELRQKVKDELQARLDKLPKNDPRALLDFVEEVLSEIGYTRI